MENVYQLSTLEWGEFGSRIPQATKGALERYIVKGFEPGGFLECVLSNDLKGACARADIFNQAVLYDIVAWLHNYAPSECWGSKERYLDWLTRYSEKVWLEPEAHAKGIAEGIRHINEDHF
jgi:hypothetical protein